MQMRDRVLRHLKRHGPSTVRELSRALRISLNTARHHLLRLQREGAVRAEAPLEAGRPGRPAWRYALTIEAEDAFPKRYPELLAALLAEAEAQGVLAELLDAVAERLAARVRLRLSGTSPRERLVQLLRTLDYGDMLPALTVTPGAWRLVAHNCVYREAGCQAAGVCDLLPQVVTRATGLAAERVACQRDGERACTFTGSLTGG